MRKYLAATIAALTLLFTGITALETSQPVAAAEITCKRNIFNGQFRSSCSKFGSANESWYQRVRVVCNNGLYDIAHDGPTRYIYQYPTDNWSASNGCASGEQFKYYTTVVWRG